MRNIYIERNECICFPQHNILISYNASKLHLIPIPPRYTSHPCAPQKINKKKTAPRKNLCCLHTHWNMVKLLPSGHTLKDN